MILEKPYCHYPFEHLHVHPDGRLFMCCYQRLIPIGNILQQDFKEIWYGPIANSIREDIIKSELPEACKGGGCPFIHVPRHSSNPVETVNLPNIFFIYLPNSHCNIGGTRPTEKNPACIMCERDAPNYPFDDTNRLSEIIPLLKPHSANVGQIHVQGVAESFWKDAIFDVMNLFEFEKIKHRVRITTVTNGILLNKNRLNRFLETAPHVGLGWSIDAANPETYKKIRRLNGYDVVCENIREYSNARKLRPDMGFKIQHNINTLNVGEVVEMVRFAATVQPEVLEFSVTSSTGHRDELLVNAKNAHLFKEAQYAAEVESKRLGVNTTFLTPLDLNLAH